MLIVSDFKDYYDSVQNLGVDKSCVFNRKTVKLNIKKKSYFLNKVADLPFVVPHTQHINNIEYHIFVVGFCGKIYYGYYWWDAKESKRKISYDLEWLEREKDKKGKRNWYFSWDSSLRAADMRKIEEKDFSEMFFKHKSPIFLYVNDPVNRDYLYLNTELKDFEFYKIKDTYSAYQDIYSYLSGVLGNTEKPTIEVSEKDKVTSKGFDKWSFRNPDPPKRKLKK